MTAKPKKGAKAPSTTETPAFLLAGHIVNDKRLASHYDALKKALPKRLRTHANITDFLRALSEVVHNSEMLALPQNPEAKDTVAAPSKTRDTALLVTKQATNLLNALAELRRDALLDFEGQFVGLLHDRDRDKFLAKLNDARTPVHEIFGDAFLNKLYADLEQLRDAATLVAENVSVKPHNQPSKGHGKNIARGVAENWLRCFGEMPSADPNDANKTSFSKFLRVLADELRNSAGTTLLQSLYTREFTIGATVAHDALAKIKGGSSPVFPGLIPRIY
jgi:hypothetical protein